MESLIPMLNAIDSFMWGPPLITLLVGTGIYLTVRLGLIQVFKLPTALRLIFSAKPTIPSAPPSRTSGTPAPSRDPTDPGSSGCCSK